MPNKVFRVKIYFFAIKSRIKNEKQILCDVTLFFIFVDIQTLYYIYIDYYQIIVNQFIYCVNWND
jgi:hypothetical protein